MGELIVRDDGQLRRIDRAIAAIEARSAAEQRRMRCLLDALHGERAELLRHDPRQKRRAAVLA